MSLPNLLPQTEISQNMLHRTEKQPHKKVTCTKLDSETLRRENTSKINNAENLLQLCKLCCTNN